MSLHDLTALEQAAAIKSGDTTSVELAEHYLRRSESVPGAYVKLTPSSPSSKPAPLTRRWRKVVRRASCSGSCAR